MGIDGIIGWKKIVFSLWYMCVNDLEVGDGVINNMEVIKKIKQIYSSGGNIIRYLKNADHRMQNEIEDIMISYDFQAGSYTDVFRNHAEYGFIKKCQAEKLAGIIDGFSCPIESLLEAGVGEATTLVPTWGYLKRKDIEWFGGNDISYSRIHVARQFAAAEGAETANLFVADIFDMPIKDNGMDVVYTFHSMEPNGSFESELLDELYRIAKKYIILIEPDYNLADAAGKRRMDENGYVKDVAVIARNKGWKIIVDEPFGIDSNALNPAGVLVIEKKPEAESDRSASKFCCPVTHTALEVIGNAYFSMESLLAYPILNGIPCLRKENAILATKMAEGIRDEV